MRVTLATLFALLLITSSAAAFQDAGATEDEPKRELKELIKESSISTSVQVPDGFQPGRIQNARESKIASIHEHRKAELGYVRKLHEMPVFEIGPVDIDADVILTVDGVPVTRSLFRKRALLYAAAGDLERHALRTITAAELSRRAERGIDISAFQASPQDIAAKLEEYRALMKMGIDQSDAAAGVDTAAKSEEQFNAWVESMKVALGEEKFHQYLAADAQFEKVFLAVPSVPLNELESHKAELNRLGQEGQLPEPIILGPHTERPEWMPTATWDAFQMTEQSRNLLGFILTQGRNRAGLPQLFKPSIVSQLRDGVMKVTGVRYFFDEEMPDGVLMRVGDHEVGVDEAWALINPILSDADIEMILRETVALHAAKTAMQAAGAWLDTAEWDELWGSYEQEFEGTLLPMKTVITFRGYNSVHRFREHLRFGKSFNNMVLDTITDEEVLDHFQGGGRLFFERGEVVLAPAFRAMTDDFSKAAWAAAEAEMAQVIEESDGDWDVVQARYPTPGLKDGETTVKGQRNRLNIAFRESELTQIVTGYGLVHEAFYRASEGDVIGPWAATMRHHQWGDAPGVWAAKVVEFNRPGGLPQFVKGDRNYDMAYEDYLNLRFIDWMNATVEAAIPTIAVP